ncbi:MAG: Spermidine N(1)-acetyltransferase [Desulfovibrio sp.]
MAVDTIRLRPLEREDLRFVHGLDNDAAVMRYWFEEPYEAFVELQELYDKHIHDQSERRFVLTMGEDNIGLVELIEIDYIHRRAEFQIIVHPDHQGKGYARQATMLALSYAFDTLNMHKIYLVVDSENTKAIHVYEGLGFIQEGLLRQEFYTNGSYRDVLRMCMFKAAYKEKGLT